MKLNIQTSVLALALGLLISSSSSAQVPVKPGKFGNQTPGNVRHNRQRNGNNENKAMHLAMHQSKEALKLLQSALPIYQGRRSNSINQTRIAINEIQIGILSTRGGNNGQPNAGNQTQQATLDSQSKRGYSNEQIQASQRKMANAIEHLQKALASLNQPQPDYNGHRANAIVAVQNAIQLAQQGINLINSN